VNPCNDIMKIIYIAHQKTHIAESDRQENAADGQPHNYTHGQACFSEKLFQLKEDIQGLLSQIEENLD
jgi:hypothetical protein